MMYLIESKHKMNLSWEFIDQTNSLTEAIRWLEYYRNHFGHRGWTIRLCKRRGKKYETMAA